MKQTTDPRPESSCPIFEDCPVLSTPARLTGATVHRKYLYAKKKPMS